MANQWDQTDPDTTDSNEPKDNNLRQYLKKLEKERDELKAKVETATAELRKQHVANIVTQEKYNVKVADLIPSTVDPTPEAIQKWLQDYGSLFRSEETPEAPGATQDTSGDENDVDMQGYAQIQAAAARGNAPALGNQAELMRELTSKDLKPERLIELIHLHGGGVGSG